MNEIFKTTLTKIVQDKIFLGLLLIGLLTIFVGFGNNSDVSQNNNNNNNSKSENTSNKSENDAVQFEVEPKLAVDFVKWWLTGSMDYNASSALNNHQEAAKWMTSEANTMFNANFWSPDLANGILQGHYAGQFQTTDVKALAINPDGSVVVGFQGNMLFQTAKSPTVQQVLADVLVRKDKQGLRISGIYNRTMPIIGQLIH